jgi:hypothetical protein
MTQKIETISSWKSNSNFMYDTYGIRFSDPADPDQIPDP